MCASVWSSCGGDDRVAGDLWPSRRGRSALVSTGTGATPSTWPASPAPSRPVSGPAPVAVASWAARAAEPSCAITAALLAPDRRHARPPGPSDLSRLLLPAGLPGRAGRTLAVGNPVTARRLQRMDQPIEASTTIPTAFSGVGEVLSTTPARCSPTPLPPRNARHAGSAWTSSERRRRRERAPGGHLALGPPADDADELVVPLTWHASGREELFPAFPGELRARSEGSGTSLRLTGTYHVPLVPSASSVTRSPVVVWRGGRWGRWANASPRASSPRRASRADAESAERQRPPTLSRYTTASTRRSTSPDGGATPRP